MALNRRHLTGEGDFVDISMFESVLAASPNIMGPVFGGDRAPERLNERTHGGNAMLNVYETGDGQYLALGGGEHKFVEALFEGLGDQTSSAVTGPAGEGSLGGHRLLARYLPHPPKKRMGKVVLRPGHMLEPCCIAA